MKEEKEEKPFLDHQRGYQHLKEKEGREGGGRGEKRRKEGRNWP